MTSLFPSPPALENTTLSPPALERDRQAVEHIDAQMCFEAIDALEAGGKKSGRLGRLTYEFRMGDRVNENRRFYPDSECAMAFVELHRRVARRNIFGRLDHPAWHDPELMDVTVRDAAIRLVEVEYKDRKAKVVCDILDNALGRQLRSVLDNEGNPGLSQRGFVSDWRDMTDEERSAFNVPATDYVRVAVGLRLLTYDIVGEPGFEDARDPAATESGKSGATEMTLTFDQFMAQHPALYQQAVERGKAEAARNTSATEAEKQLETIKGEKAAVETKLAAAETARNEAVEALRKVKPALIKLGIVNEQITDAEAGARLAASESEVTQLKTAKTAVETKLQETEAELAKLRAEKATAEALTAVHQKYAADSRVGLIIAQVRGHNPTTTDQAVRLADEAVALLEKAGVKNAGQATPPAKEGSGGNSFLGPEVANLITANFANPQGTPPAKEGSGGNSSEKAAMENLIGKAIFGGVLTGMH